MNTVLQTIFETGKVVDKKGVERNVDSHITKEEGEFLTSTIKLIKAEIAVEVGMAYGVSSIFISDGLQKSERTKHYIIAPFQNDSRYWDSIGLLNMKKAGYENIIKFLEVPSHIGLPQLEVEKVEADFAFIDGQHLFDYVLVDFFLTDKILKIGGVVVFDDLDYLSINKVCKFIINNCNYKIFGKYEINENKKSKKRKLLDTFINIISKNKYLKNYFKTIETDNNIPNSRYLAFQKIGNDNRHWTHFVDF